MLCSLESRNLESGGTEKDLQQQDFVSAAVLLSPPRQRDGLRPAGQSEVWQDLSFCQLTPCSVEGLTLTSITVVVVVHIHNSNATFWKMLKWMKIHRDIKIGPIQI